ncbi:hypothetical protein ABID65_003672, partial [Bradyrhizobium sp. S3.9.2]
MQKIFLAGIAAAGLLSGSALASDLPTKAPLYQAPIVALTCPCRFPPVEVRVRPSEGRTDEASQVYGRAD